MEWGLGKMMMEEQGPDLVWGTEERGKVDIFNIIKHTQNRNMSSKKEISQKGIHVN